MSASTQTLSRPGEAPRRVRSLGRFPAWDVAIAGVLAAATFVVHNMSYLLSQPFWLDETWVAVSTKLPLRAVAQVTSTTPIGWTVLLRTMVLGGEQRYRLLPMAFAALSVLAAYLLARSVPWRSAWWGRLAGGLAATAVLLAPSSLARNDLKPYTADAFLTLTVLLLLSRLEARWSRRRLMALSATCVVGFLISVAVLFVAAAAFAALTLACLLRRDRRRALEAAGAGAVTGALLGAFFVLFYLPHVGNDISQYWQGFYLPVDQGVRASLDYLHLRGDQMAAYLGMGPLLVGYALVAAGILTLARSRRPAVALTPPVLVAEMIVLGAVKKYPLFDERTSHFLTVAAAALAAIGVAGLCSLLARTNALAAVATATALTVLFLVGVRPDIRGQTIPDEDVRSPTAYVAAHQRPADIVVVSSAANYGFGFYARRGSLSWQRTSTGVHFSTLFRGRSRIIYGKGREAATISTAVEQAVTSAARTRGARVWLVRMHVTGVEASAWTTALARQRVRVTGVIHCSLVLLTPLSATVPPDPSSVRAAACR